MQDLSSLGMFIVASIVPSLVVAWLATYLMRSLAPRMGLIDKPNHRKVHTTPTPMGGGVAVWAGVIGVFLLGTLVLLAIDPQSPPTFVPDFAKAHLAGISSQIKDLWLLLTAATILAALGLADDLRGLAWQLRLAIQFVVAVTVVTLVPELRITAFLELSPLTIALSVLWIVALVNSFNMLDNMDGLSAGVGTIASLMLAAVLLFAPDVGSQGPQLFVSGLLLVLAGALIGFLLHNRPPAKIFMGDAGSYFLGFVIAAATLLASYAGYKGEKAHAIFAPLCVMAVPLYDMSTVILIRLRRGLSPFHPDKNHFSHRLVELGFTKPQAVLMVYLVSFTCGLGALLLPRVDEVGAAIVLLLEASLLVLVGLLEWVARRTIAQD